MTDQNLSQITDEDLAKAGLTRRNEMKKTEKKYIECALEEATGLRNSIGTIVMGKYCTGCKAFQFADGDKWYENFIEFSKLTPVKEVQVEVLPEWVTDDRIIYTAHWSSAHNYAEWVFPEDKRRAFIKGIPVFFTSEEAIAAADAQIARMIAERDGEVVRFEAHWDCMVRTFPEELHNKFAGKRVEFTVREVKGNA
jgi:hypothetical protein